MLNFRSALLASEQHFICEGKRRATAFAQQQYRSNAATYRMHIRFCHAERLAGRLQPNGPA
jgi:hypothetical protein